MYLISLLCTCFLKEVLLSQIVLASGLSLKEDIEGNGKGGGRGGEEERAKEGRGEEGRGREGKTKSLS